MLVKGAPCDRIFQDIVKPWEANELYIYMNKLSTNKTFLAVQKLCEKSQYDNLY